VVFPDGLETTAAIAYSGDTNALLYLRARFYAPGIGQFLTSDSWQGDYNRPLSLNRWRYVERTERLSLMLVVSLAVVLAVLFVNGVIGSLLPQLFGETINSSAGFGSLFPESAWQSFLLAGAGISEETTYRQLWERPLTVFTMSVVMGVVMGYVYLKHGYETAVLGHTLGDWAGLMLSRMV